MFGSEVANAENIRHQQRKVIKYNHLNESPPTLHKRLRAKLLTAYRR